MRGEGRSVAWPSGGWLQRKERRERDPWPGRLVAGCGVKGGGKRTAAWPYGGWPWTGRLMGEVGDGRWCERCSGGGWPAGVPARIREF